MDEDKRITKRIYDNLFPPKPLKRVKVWKVDTEERNAQKVLDKISKKLGI